MRLITFQDKYVIDKIEYEEENGRLPIYINNNFYFNKKQEAFILKFKERMKKELKLPKLATPIFCWVVKKNEEITDELINELYLRYIPKCGRLTMIELEVPNDGVFISNYEIWSRLMFNLQINKGLKDDDFEELFAKQKGAVIQAVIPFIHKRFITSYKIMDDILARDYSQTEQELQTMINNNEVELDEYGNIESFTD